MNKTTRLVVFTAVTGLVLLTLLPNLALASPRGNIRHKRVSDQRLAELETLLALANMKGRLVTVPVAFGRVDPAKIGRRRRSIDSTFLQKLRPIEWNFDSEEFANEMPIQSWLRMQDEKEDNLLNF